jgi:predicted nucleic acid-binding protein
MVPLKARYLVDKSALARMPSSAVIERLGPIIEGGAAATCAIVELELLYSGRSYEDVVRIRERRALAYHRVALTEAVFERALDVQQALARSGRHRVPIPDLVIAAAAESAGLIVLHYDKHYDVIADVTGQPTEWVVPRGSVD